MLSLNSALFFTFKGCCQWLDFFYKQYCLSTFAVCTKHKGLILRELTCRLGKQLIWATNKNHKFFDREISNWIYWNNLHVTLVWKSALEIPIESQSMFFSSEAQWPLLPSNIVVHCRPTTFQTEQQHLGSIGRNV